MAYVSDFPKLGEFLSLSDQVKKTMVLIDDPSALAWAWMSAYADQLEAQANGSYDADEYGYEEPITAEMLIEIGLSHIPPSHSNYGEFLSRGAAFEGEGLDPMFWDKLSILIGQPIPNSSKGSFFSCSC